jgi:hypothetical protein
MTRPPPIGETLLVSPYVPCPWSLRDLNPRNQEPQPHQLGIWYRNGRRLCAVCERPVSLDGRSTA